MERAIEMMSASSASMRSSLAAAVFVSVPPQACVMPSMIAKRSGPD